MDDQILVRGARLHNLKNITVAIPKNKLVVLTGLSGSGKSTLAFDTLYQEGARQYMESLGMVIHEMSKPPLDSLVGLSPSISVDQYLTNRSPRSTVGTSTEVFTYLRVLFARLGHCPCPTCEADVPPNLEAADWELGEAEPAGDGSEAEAGEGTPCPSCGFLLAEISMANFSFNKPEGACPTCTGLGVTADLILENIFDPALGVAEGGVKNWDPYNLERNIVTLQRAAAHYGFPFDPHTPLAELDSAVRDLLYYGVNSPQIKARFPKIAPPPTVLKGHFEGVVTNLRRRYNEGLGDMILGVKTEMLFAKRTCPDCGGTRLKPESRAVRVDGRSIIELSQVSLAELAGWLKRLPERLSESENLIAAEAVDDLERRIRRLVNIGVGYLTMERTTHTLSAGEQQRLRLASLLGSGLTGVLYVLDEPTIGLHQRDTARLIAALKQLRDLGNTVLVIEHDLETIRAADHVIEFGPGAGKNGGYVVATGTPEEIAAAEGSPTGAYLSGRERLPEVEARREDYGRLTIRGARVHNLKDLTVSIPLGKLTAVTGVSGSGKSSLIFDVLDRAARRRFNGSTEAVGEHDSIEGWEGIERVVTVDQAPIGRVPRSNAATYTEVFTPIREAFAALPEAKVRGMTARFFSFNTPGGRCERCQGAGTLTVNMQFLPDVQVRCPACRGKRFKKEVLAAKYGGASIADVLEMTIDEALALFGDDRHSERSAAQSKETAAILGRLSLLSEVGLGYLQLGQPATTLSGGESQRVKLAKELGRPGNGRALYLLDEPTTGLHLADVARLLALLQRLVKAGNSVVVVEHHLELIARADWVIDLGLEGGDAGGELIAAGTPEEVMQMERSYTGQWLRKGRG